MLPLCPMVAAFQVIGRHFVTPAALLKQSKHSASQESKPPRSSCAQCNSSGSPCPIGFKGQLELLLSAKLISKRFQLALQKWAFPSSFHCFVFFFSSLIQCFLGKSPTVLGWLCPRSHHSPWAGGCSFPGAPQPLGSVFPLLTGSQALPPLLSATLSLVPALPHCTIGYYSC